MMRTPAFIHAPYVGNMAKVARDFPVSWIVTAVGLAALALQGIRPGRLFTSVLAAWPSAEAHMAGRFTSRTFYPYFISLAIRERTRCEFRARLRVAFAAGVITSTPVITCAGSHRADSGSRRSPTSAAELTGRSAPSRVGRDPAGGIHFHRRLDLVQRLHVRGSLRTRRGFDERRHGVEHLASRVGVLGLAIGGAELEARETPSATWPLACMLGTAGAAVNLHFFLSTTVIPASCPTRDSRFQRSVGSSLRQDVQSGGRLVVMVLASSRLPRSLLGWQFTPGPDREEKNGGGGDDGMFPPVVLDRRTAVGAPIAGMVHQGVVQSLMALMPIPPISTSRQRAGQPPPWTKSAVHPPLSACPHPVESGRRRPDEWDHMSVACGDALQSVYAILAAGRMRFRRKVVMGMASSSGLPRVSIHRERNRWSAA